MDSNTDNTSNAKRSIFHAILALYAYYLLGLIGGCPSFSDRLCLQYFCLSFSVEREGHHHGHLLSLENFQLAGSPKMSTTGSSRSFPTEGSHVVSNGCCVFRRVSAINMTSRDWIASHAKPLSPTLLYYITLARDPKKRRRIKSTKECKESTSETSNSGNIYRNIVIVLVENLRILDASSIETMTN